MAFLNAPFEDAVFRAGVVDPEKAPLFLSKHSVSDPQNLLVQLEPQLTSAFFLGS